MQYLLPPLPMDHFDPASDLLLPRSIMNDQRNSSAVQIMHPALQLRKRRCVLTARREKVGRLPSMMTKRETIEIEVTDCDPNGCHENLS